MTVHAREHYADNAGVRIHGLEWTPDLDPGGVPMVFVPGGTANAWSGEDLGRDAASGLIGGRPRALLSISRRGTGSSDAPPSGYGPAEFASDVEALARRAGYARFVLFGHSMGVPISLEYALRYPSRLSGLVLGDAPAAYIDFRAAGTFDRALTRPFEFANADEALQEFSRGFDDSDRARRDFQRVGHRYFAPRGASVRRLLDREALERLIAESVGAATQYWGRLAQIVCPVMLLQGTGGEWSPLSEDDITRYQTALPGLQVERVPGGHQLGLLGDRAPLLAVLGSFVRGIDAAEGVAVGGTPADR